LTAEEIDNHGHEFRLEPDPPWLAEWSKARHPIAPEGVEWIRSRPDSVKAVMRKIPPSCVVRLPCGCLGVVASIFEDGGISVRKAPGEAARYRVPQTKMEKIEIFAFWNGITHERIAEILS